MLTMKYKKKTPFQCDQMVEYKEAQTFPKISHSSFIVEKVKLSHLVQQVVK